MLCRSRRRAARSIGSSGVAVTTRLVIIPFRLSPLFSATALEISYAVTMPISLLLAEITGKWLICFPIMILAASCTLIASRTVMLGSITSRTSGTAESCFMGFSVACCGSRAVGRASSNAPLCIRAASSVAISFALKKLDMDDVRTSLPLRSIIPDFSSS